MTIRKEIALRDFEFWSGGAYRANNCSAEELDTLEQFFEETEPEDGWSDTAINDMFWFEFDTLAQYLGYKDEEDFDRKRDPNYIDDDDLVDYCDEWFYEIIDDLKAQGDEKSHNLLGDIAYECFDYYSEVEENPEYGEDNYDFLSEIHDNQTIFDALFTDNIGNTVACEVIPTLEDFRDEIMNKLSKENSNE